MGSKPRASSTPAQSSRPQPPRFQARQPSSRSHYLRVVTRVLTVDPDAPDPAAIAEAAAVIRSGGLVVFPTETVYGLGGNALDATAVARIFAAKGRPAYNPLIVHVADVQAACGVVLEWPDTAARLAAAFWPGPLTLVLLKQPAISSQATAGLPTVGVRVPAHAVARALLRAADRPIAAPSANLSTAVSPTAADHVPDALLDRGDLLLDAGPATVGIESTVLDLTQPIPTILRPGVVSATDLESIVGEVRTTVWHGAESGARPSPGLLDRHYAPRAALVVIGASQMGREVNAWSAKGLIVAILARTSNLGPQSAHVEHMPEDPSGYARILYATLHALDRLGMGVILVERVPDGPEWDGVRDRLARAEHREP